jgi:hypothetical protein
VEGDRLNPLITFRGHVALIAAKEVIHRHHTPLESDEAGLYEDSDRTITQGGRDERTVSLRALRREQLDGIAQDVRDLTDVICEALEHDRRALR